MKLLFVAIHIEPSARAVPLGPAMLAAVLDRQFSGCVDTQILDLYVDQTVDDCMTQILAHAPDCIGFSVYMWNRNRTLEIAQLLKQDNPDRVLFAGGPEVSMGQGPDIAMGLFDFVLPGECEASIVPVIEYLLAGGAPQRLSENVAMNPVKDLSCLPSPYLDGTLDLKQYQGVLWELSRGCPYKCDFCYESRGQSGIRRYPMKRITDELRLFSEAGVEQIFVLDPTFNYNKAKAKSVLRLIRDVAPEIYFFFEVRSEFIDAELAELFASIPCSLQIGLQSVSDRVLKNVNRSIDAVDFEQKVFLLHQAGAVYGFDLIYGLPGDTLKGFCKSFDFVMGFIPNHVDIFPLAVLPGTRLQETAQSLGLTYAVSVPYLVKSTSTFGVKDMAIAADMAKAFDRFYNKGQAVPWFNIVLQALSMRPSTFVRRLVRWLKLNPQDQDIVALQKAFITDLFDQQGFSQLTSLARDLVTYFGTFEMLTEEETRVAFQHDPSALLDLLSSGITDLEELADCLPESPCDASLKLENDVPSILIHEASPTSLAHDNADS